MERAYHFTIDANGKTAWAPSGAKQAAGGGSGSGYADTGLRVFNSISKKVEPFAPTLHKDQNLVTWYTCGPTVYDSSHLGHARTYVGFDIIRRIMTDYFGYKVKLCMNITDIDDKIIIRSNEQKRDFFEFSRFWETEFLKDMDSLNVRLPTVITRVSEYVPEIVEFIEGIIKEGYAYEANGSVYFNVAEFDKHPNHCYAKLEPQGQGDAERLKEGEGALGGAAEGDKKDPKDFALWKKSKAGEPEWASPWGPGRPGWHIECSAMAHEIFKEFPIDIHSGGRDLRFPHHDNELAQSEAYYGCDGWIQHFWHTGPLMIDGLKMSKSLKNFSTIKDILKVYTSRQIRFLFLMAKWNGEMQFDPEASFQEVIKKEDQFDQFFHNVKALVRQVNVKDIEQKWNDKDRQIAALLEEKQTTVHEALCDDFNTPKAVTELFVLVRETNKYMALPQKDIKIPLVRSVSKFIYKILSAFGIYEDNDYPKVASEGEELLTKILNAFTEYRDAVKANAKGDAKTLFDISDQLRDETLLHLGVQIEDKGKGPSIWKLEDPAKLLKRREDMKAEAARKAEAKRAETELKEKKQSTPGKQWFKHFELDVYSGYDEATGLPTTDVKKNKPLSKEILSKLAKQIAAQEKKYQKWLASQAEKKE